MTGLPTLSRDGSDTLEAAPEVVDAQRQLAVQNQESEGPGGLVASAFDAKKVTADLRERLRAHFDPANWFLLEEFPVGPAEGSNGSYRSVDAYAISLWNSRSHEIQGLEIKASRSDWLVELADPQKAEAGARFSDRWWVCAPKGVVHQSELPEGWGLLVPSGKGLREQVKPAKRTRVEPPRDWWISALKKLSQRPKDEDIARQVEAAYANGVQRGENQHRWAAEHVKEGLERLRKSVGEFEAASGLKIDDWNGAELGKAVRVVLEKEEFVRLTHLQFEVIEKHAEDLRKALEAAGWRYQGRDR